MNFFKYFEVYYAYFLRAVYYGLVPSIVFYGKHSKVSDSLFIGLFSKPYSPLILAMLSFLRGDEGGEDMYGAPPGGQPGYY